MNPKALTLHSKYPTPTPKSKSRNLNRTLLKSEPQIPKLTPKVDPPKEPRSTKKRAKRTHLRRGLELLSTLRLFSYGPRVGPLGHAGQKTSFGDQQSCVAKGTLGRELMAANGSKNRLHDAYLVRCRVPAYYQPSSQTLRLCQLKKYPQLKKLLHEARAPSSATTSTC